MDRNVNNEKELKPLSSNGLSQMGGGGLEQPLIQSSSPMGSKLDGHAVSKTQCPWEGTPRFAETSDFKTEGWGEG